MQSASLPSAHAFFGGGGDAGETIRGFDWNASTLGPFAAWPRALHTSINILLASKLPMLVCWGPSLILLHNDASRPLLGDGAVGQRFADLWAPHWETFGPLAEGALRGVAGCHDNLPLTLRRDGANEQRYVTVACSPIPHDDGGAGGVLCACVDTTEQRHAESGRARAQAALRDAQDQLRRALNELALTNRGVIALHAELSARAAAMQRLNDSLEGQVAARTAELTALAGHLQTAREDERNRLALELHDELGGMFTAAKLDLARIKARLGDTSGDVAQRLDHLAATLDQGIRLKRRIVEELRPSSLTHLGLSTSLRLLAEGFVDQSDAALDLDLEEVALTRSANLGVYRLVQEALSNAARHARASRVKVSVTLGDDVAIVTIEDDGIGFDPARQQPVRHGLLGLRYRLEAEGGTLRVESAPGRGTRLTATLPTLPAT